MADLHSLIRVRKHTVEQKQKFLSDLYRQAEEMEGQKRDLIETLAKEREKVDEMGVEALGYFGHYSQSVKARVEEIDDKMVKLENRIEVAREDMRMAFAELKKVEITQERREKEAKKAAQKKEDAEMDEIAIEGHRRKSSDN